MKFNRHPIRLLFTLFTLLLLSGANVSAKDVSGVIDRDTVWTAKETPHELMGAVTVASGAKLLIEPGVRIRGKKNAPGIIKLNGKIHARGTRDLPVLVENTSLVLSTVDSELNLEHAAVDTGKIICQRGNILIRNSSIKGTKIDIYSYEGEDSYIEKNIFRKSILKIGTIGKATVHVTNNAFYDYGDTGVLAYNLAAVLLKHNSFMSREGIALRVRLHEKVDATKNYWNTLDTEVMDAMIYDRNDDQNCDHKLKYIPFLTAPHPETPAP